MEKEHVPFVPSEAGMKELSLRAVLLGVVMAMFMGLAFILMQIRSPMLVSVGMYLPIETSYLPGLLLMIALGAALVRMTMRAAEAGSRS